MLRMKDTQTLFKNLIRALPAIPLLVPRRRTSVTPYIVGAVAVAIAGGIAALMLWSPRMRTRTLGIAKDGYGKVKEQLDQLAVGERLGLSPGARTTTPDAHANGLAADHASVGRTRTATP
jgi:hypothetical protein